MVSLLPIVERELRAAARKPSTYRARAIVALMTSLFAAGLLLVALLASTSRTGTTFFPVLATFAFLYCLVAGARFSADCLSEEKREGTLGFLFLSDLRSFDIIAGKFTSASVRTFQGLFAFFPVLAIGLVLGGVTPGEFWRLTAVLTGTLFFSLAVGIGVSAISREAHRALAGTVLLVGLLTVGPLVLNSMLARLWPNPWALVATSFSPATAETFAFDLLYRAHADRFWSSLLLSQVVGWAFLVLAAIALPRFWQTPSSIGARFGRARRTHFISTRQMARRTRRRRQLLEINPIFWLAARHERQRLLIGGFSAVTLATGLLVLLLSRFLGGQTFGVATGLNWLLALFLKFWVAWQACATFAEARRTGAVELLLATPLKVDEIIDGHWRALQRTFFWPLLAALGLRLLPPLESLIHQPGLRLGMLLFPIPALTLFGMATFILDLVALAWVGMWMGTTEAKAVNAFAKTILMVVIVPAIAFCLPNIIFDLFWILWARQSLEKQFRKAAEGRFAPATPPRRAPVLLQRGLAAAPPIIDPGRND
jgi:ABC-type transport system involved in multi-copper enzyme maturation permease subunit